MGGREKRRRKKGGRKMGGREKRVMGKERGRERKRDKILNYCLFIIRPTLRLEFDFMVHACIYYTDQYIY